MTTTPRPSPLRRLAAATAAVVGLSACASASGAGDEAAAPTTQVRRTTTTTTLAPTTTTTAPPTTTTVASSTTVPPPGLGSGSSGGEVLVMEQRLAELRFDVGKVDGSFDSTTYHAVMAFQKAQGLPRTGRATPDVLAALPTAGMPGPMLAGGGANRVEIDLKRQILLLFQNGQLVRTLSISTGSGKRYCVDGDCATAVTPGGSFRVGRKIKGLRVSRLGKLYNPLYFNGGIAIHGSPSVPAGPASHGCVRIPMSASLWFHDAVASGTPVYVLGGSRAPVPFNEQAPGDEAAATSTTIAPIAPITTIAPVPGPGPLPVLPLPGATTTTTVPANTTTSPPTLPPTTLPYGPPTTTAPPPPPSLSSK
ncbi:MAG: L,D-transpeptidase family protein [Acidimicrobiales bacterium]